MAILFAQNQDSLITEEWWFWLAIIIAALLVVGVFYRFFLMRLPLWILMHTVYRLRVHGAENIPATGAALLVSNHVSYIDALLIMAAARRRVRFLVWAPFMGVPGLRLLLRLADVIPIQGTSGPRAIMQALRTASEALAAGEVVCIFAEGSITRTGLTLTFQRGFQQIVKRSPAPIIPICLDAVWGSIFSYQGHKFFWKLPQSLPYKVYVNIGKALPPDADAFAVRQAIQRMSAESAVRRADETKPVHRQFVRMAVAHPFRSCIIDAMGAKPEMNNLDVLIRVKLLLKRLRPVLGKDAMVGVWLPPGGGGAMANICIACLGKVSVNLNYTSAPNIVQSSIQQCKITKVLTSKLFIHKVPLDPGPGVDLIYLEDFRKDISKVEWLRAYLGILLLPGFVHEYFLMGLGVHHVTDIATIIFSSGSTGDPKGIMLTHANVAANCHSVIQAIDPQPSDRLLGILPFFHSFGYTVTLWLPMQVGASIVYHANPLQPREIGELCKKYQCTIFLSTPTFLRTYLRRCEADDFKTLRILVCGAEKMPLSLGAEFKQKFGVEPLEGYGCTELSPVASVNVPDYQEGSVKQVGNKPGTIGQPIPGVAARVVHRETLKDLPQGQEGLLLIHGANVMKGYLGKEELTEKKIVDGGWYITGDLAFIDEEGFITITGREERFAKIGGEMVPLEKVEDELHQILKTTDKVVAVTAIPDAKKGERIIVLHIALPELTPRDLWRQLGERGLPNIYLPGQRDFYQVPELPVLGSGKLDLKKCKQMAQEVAAAGGE